jgi:hypothetical protein
VKTRWNLLTCGAIKINTSTERDFVFEVTLVVQGEDKRSVYETLILQVNFSFEFILVFLGLILHAWFLFNSLG